MGLTYGFFFSRKRVDFGVSSDIDTKTPLVCENVPHVIAGVLSTKLATLHELQTVYGLEDAYDLLEVAMVDGHNLARSYDVSHDN